MARKPPADRNTIAPIPDDPDEAVLPMPEELASPPTHSQQTIDACVAHKDLAVTRKNVDALVSWMDKTLKPTLQDERHEELKVMAERTIGNEPRPRIKKLEEQMDDKLKREALEPFKVLAENAKYNLDHGHPVPAGTEEVVQHLLQLKAVMECEAENPQTGLPSKPPGSKRQH
jgi:hypothetical protein